MRVLIIAISIFWFSCGQAGRDGGKPPKPTDDEDPALNLTTTVGVDALGYGFPFLTTCLGSDGAAGLQRLDETFVLDGDLAEWVLPAQVRDTALDAAPEFDLQSVYVGEHGGQLVMAIPGGASLNHLNLEFGGLLVKQDSVYSSINLKLRLVGGKIYEGDDAIDEAYAKVVYKDGAAEIWLSRRLLGEAVTWPVWSLRFFTGDGDIQDNLQAVYFSSMLSSDVSSFRLAGCDEWAGKQGDATIQYILDSDEAIIDESDSIKTEAEWAAQLVRLAFNEVSELVGKPVISHGSLPVLITAKSVNESPTRFARSVNGAVHDLSRGLRINTDSFRSNYHFPEGEVFSRAVEFFLEFYLLNAAQGDQTYGHYPVKQALKDVVVQKVIGPGYWLDHYETDYEKFLKTLNTADTETLGEKHLRILSDDFDSEEEKRTYSELAIAKANALGKFLLHFVPTDVLLAGWTKYSGDLPDVQRYYEARSGYDRTADFWPGWTVSGDFRPYGNPELLRDRDADGLKDLMEQSLGTRADKQDTDRDGWSDLAEFIKDTNPKSLRVRPKELVPDGEFGDWFKLMPKKLRTDEINSGNCDAEITHYSAVADRHEMIIAAMSRNYKGSSQLFWEIIMEVVPEEKQFMVIGKSLSPLFEIRNHKRNRLIKYHRKAYSVGKAALEFGFNRRDFGIDTHLNQPAKIRMKIDLKMRDKDTTLPCDETDWFSPYVN